MTVEVDKGNTCRQSWDVLKTSATHMRALGFVYNSATVNLAPMLVPPVVILLTLRTAIPSYATMPTSLEVLAFILCHLQARLVPTHEELPACVCLQEVCKGSCGFQEGGVSPHPLCCSCWISFDRPSEYFSPWPALQYNQSKFEKAPRFLVVLIQDPHE